MNHAPKRSLGQNFLVDRQAAERFVEGLGLGEEARVLEIGPGRGALTDVVLQLLGPDARFAVVEKDDSYAARWAERLEADPRCQVLHGDVLRLDPLEVPLGRPYRVLGNLPYNIAGRIAMQFLEARDEEGRPCCDRLVLGFQKEVAQRFTARPGSPAYTAVSVMVQAQARSRALFDLPPGAYRPQPKVWSQVVLLAPLERRLVDERRWPRFRGLVQAAFRSRRKQMLNALRGAPPDLGIDDAAALLERAAVPPQARAQELPVEAFVRLCDALDPGPDAV